MFKLNILLNSQLCTGDGCICKIFSLCRHVFITQKAYQETEDRPDSSVYTEMRGVAMLGDSILDKTEYVQPSEVREDNSVTKFLFFIKIFYKKLFIIQ